jgi:hypothetical protein
MGAEVPIPRKMVAPHRSALGGGSTADAGGGSSAAPPAPGGSIGTGALGWTIAFAACAALSWSLEWMRRRGAGDGAGPASA